MNSKDNIIKELNIIIKDGDNLLGLATDKKEFIEFSAKYQMWYSRALKLISLLGLDRLEEFRSYYLIDQKIKTTSAGDYTIQDYIKGLGARCDCLDKPLWDINNMVMIRVHTQIKILQSLASRIDSVLADVEGYLFADLQDAELKAAQKILAVNLRASGTLAGVVLERHLQRVAINHGIKIKKANPTINDLNDPLKQAGVYETVIFRKIQLLGDLRNLCSHNNSKSTG